MYIYFTLDSRIGRLLRRIRPKGKSVEAKESVDSAVDADDGNFVVSQLIIVQVNLLWDVYTIVAV